MGGQSSDKKIERSERREQSVLASSRWGPGACLRAPGGVQGQSPGGVQGADPQKLLGFCYLQTHKNGSPAHKL